MIHRIHGRTVTVALARQILRENFLGAEQSVTHFKLSPTPSELERLSAVPWSENELIHLRDSHLLVAVFPISLAQILQSVPSVMHGQSWYDSEPFAHRRGNSKWWLIAKSCPERFLSRNWEGQVQMLQRAAAIPTVRVFAYSIGIYYLANHRHLFPSLLVRCKDVISSSCHITAGEFQLDGLRISYEWDRHCASTLGVAQGMNRQ
jgi:hypothetical protein